MPLSLWKCATALLVEKKRTSAPKKKKKQRSGESRSPSLSESRLQQEEKLRVALEEASEDGSLAFVSQDPTAAAAERDASSSAQGRARRLHALREFLRSSALAADRSHYSPLSLPSLEDSFCKFLVMYPKYRSTDRIDRLRAEEYPHLSLKVCLDYCGFGLFSALQPHGGDSFALSELTANLGNHALYGSGADPGTCEHGVKRRILDYLNVPDHEYGLVFTVSRGSAFKLLADSYPFQPHGSRLLTMFDHDSQSVHLMAHSARLRGAKVHSAWFRWPTLKPCSAELRKQIVGKKRRKKDASAGLFVFPVQSRVTGARYSYQWMALAQQNGWHVLLDAGSLGPKDMDSLGLSLFRPDFIITSFYRVFGADPTGFGVLLIKKSVIGCLKNMNGKTGSGMVRIVPVYPQYWSDSIDGWSFEEKDAVVEDVNQEESPSPEMHGGGGPSMPVFSGVFTSAQVRDVFDSEMEQGNGSDRDGPSMLLEETESVSVGDLMKSPPFSEEGSSDSLLWIELGHSPYGSSDCSGQLNAQRQGPLSPPLWFSKRKGKEQLSLRVQSVMSNNPICDNTTNNGNNDDVLSFDAAVLSVSQELDRAKEVPENEPLENGEKHVFFHFPRVEEEGLEIQEEEGILEVDAVVEGSKRSGSDSGSRCRKDCRIGTSEICEEKAPCTKENAITRETESDFRLLDRREGNNVFMGGRLFGREDHDQALGTSSRRVQTSSYPSARETVTSATEDDTMTDEGGDTNEWQREPEIICRHLDHVNLMGLNKSSSRLRFLVNWLVISLLQLKHPDPEGKDGVRLVFIYGPKIKYERGASVAFNVKDSKKALINPEVVQKLAEKNGLSLGVGFLSHVLTTENDKQLLGPVDLGDAPFYKPSSTGNRDGKSIIRVEVVTASLGFLTNFEDVYKLWAFIAKFLDPTFVEGEKLPTITEAPES